MSKKRLLIENVELMKEWDWEANVAVGLNPHTIYCSKGILANWICSKCGHHFVSSIRTRVAGRGKCPKCDADVRSRKRSETFVKKSGSVADSPLIKEWDYENNDKLGLDPKLLTLGSNRKAFWKCPRCGNHYEAKILNRGINKRGCPYCANHKIKPGFNDLASTHPDLVKEWDFEKNEIKPTEVSRGCGKKVWWKCPLGHRYQATILHRTNGNTGCPVCNSGRQTSFAEQAVYFYVRKIFPDAINRYKDIFTNGMELDIYIPSKKIGIEYDGVYFHKDDKTEREIRKNKICQEHGIRLIRIKEQGMENESRYQIAQTVFFGENLEKRTCLSQMIQNLLIELTKFSVRPYSVFPFEVNLDKDEFEIRNYMIDREKNSFEAFYPELAKEWCYEKNGNLKPNMFPPKSGMKVYWKCKECGHVWKTSLGQRASGCGCPVCYRQRNKGGNSPRAKKVYQYSMDGRFIKEWECISDVERELKINASNVSMCAAHKRPNAGGYRWEFIKCDGVGPLAKKEKKSMVGRNGKAVLQMDSQGNEIARYRSMREAGIALGKNSSSITRVIKGQLKTFAGYYWKLVEKK